ncbi:L-threonylcarbamoyladenylate synthase [Agilicoccus flavus]|uniref:L-threonylcarbamoyladenylate synthase n=1 Tax=Agilicoccus flavus TaxID=2775968 RepID=UPI0027D9EB69|nr:L-threonylcarbamoyladenylate synthase [Agilicoccus flavus]
MSTVIDATGAEERSDDGPQQDRPEPDLALVVEAVRRGALVVLPTDTVYGIGADAFDAEAVGELLAAKGRGRDMPPPVLVPNKRTVDGLATEVPAYARRLIDRYWPGPVTLVLKAQASLRWDLGDTNGTVAVRMPDHEVALEVLADTGPLAVSSANRHGQPAATTAAQAREQLGDAVEVYVEAGPAPGGVASTIVDCTKDAPAILREGAVPAAEVFAIAGVGDPTDADAPAADVADADADAPEADTPADTDPATDTDVAGPARAAAPGDGDAGATAVDRPEPAGPSDDEVLVEAFAPEGDRADVPADDAGDADHADDSDDVGAPRRSTEPGPRG